MIIDTKNIRIRPWLPWIITIIGIVFLLLFIFHVVRVPGKDPLYEYLQHQTDSILKVDRILTADSVRQKVIDSLMAEVGSKETRIKTITKYREKAIYLYRDYNADSVRKAYAERAGKSR